MWIVKIVIQASEFVQSTIGQDKINQKTKTVSVSLTNESITLQTNVMHCKNFPEALSLQIKYVRNSAASADVGEM